MLQDADKFKSRMHSLAYGNVMAAAARDYQQARSAYVAVTLFSCIFRDAQASCVLFLHEAQGLYSRLASDLRA